MKLRSLLSIAAMAATFSASAQWVNDSVSMGAGYVNDVYYSLQNGQQSTISNTNWHIGFQMTPQGPYGNVSVIANHNAGKVKVYNLHKGATASFTTVAAADTAGITATPQMYNADSSWNYGAFSHATNLANPFDFGWGTYNVTTHFVDGDSVYLLNIDSSGVNIAYKLWIKQYVSTPATAVKWTFRIARLDNSNDTTISINQSDYPNRMFAYYNATTRTVADREQTRFGWDMLFTRYIGYVNQGSGPVPYPLTGVLSNFGVTVADVRGVNPDTTHYYGRTFNKNMSEIGADWKTYVNPGPNGYYQVDTTATFFIRTTNTQEYWQLKFTGFRSSTGTIVFAKRWLTTTAVTTINNTVANYYVAPQPANNEVSLMIDTKEKTTGAQLFVTDLSGRTIYSQAITLNNGMNVFKVPTSNFPTGMYVLSVAGQNLKLSQKITVAH